MNRVIPLVETPLLRITRFEHPEEEPHHDPREEYSPSISLSFVLRGSFEIRAGSKTFEVTPRTVFATRPGLSYSTRHAHDRPTDVCLSVDFSPEFLGSECSEVFSAEPVLELTNRTAHLKWRLERALERNRDPAPFEEIGAELLTSVGVPEPGAKLFGERSFAWYAERIEQARDLLATSFREGHSLGSLSRTVGMSPFHFARLFRSLVGVPPGRYLLFTRLDYAHRLLREGRLVTDVCFDCGFRNLSYFARAFRKRYRISPSAVRRHKRN
jgi:AraC family transcriptional regulator